MNRNIIYGSMAGCGVILVIIGFGMLFGGLPAIVKNKVYDVSIIVLKASFNQ